MVSKRVKYAGVAIGALVGLILLGFVLGFFGTPSVDGVENRFAGVNDTTTTVETNVTVNNPNPIDITLGGVDLDYDIAMNDVHMADGQRDDVSAGPGTSTVQLQTLLQNEQIPEWWYTHVDRGERTNVTIDVDLSHGLLGGNAISIEQDKQIQTDILSAFNSTEPRPINLNRPLIEDPVLYLNETTGHYGSNLTRERTPLDMAFTFYNPKPWPYRITEVGYEIDMNDIQVGEGATERSATIPGGASERINASTVIANQRLDEWWVSHLERNQVTDLFVDFYIVVDPGPTGITDAEPFRIDAPELDYETTIETDIFGTKLATDNGTDDGSSDDADDGTGSDGESTPDDSDGSTDDSTDGDATSIPGDSDGTTDDGTEDGDSTPTPDDSDATPTPTPTPTPDDGGIIDGGSDDDDDDGLLSIGSLPVPVLTLFSSQIATRLDYSPTSIQRCSVR
jgi:LEA14-like dessication related protein